MAITTSRQGFLDELVKNRDRANDSAVRCLTWNIQNSSLQRATRQVKWLQKNDFDIIVLTEAKLSDGCAYIKDRLTSLGYVTIFPKPENNDYSQILAVRKFFKEAPKIPVDFLPYRVSSAVCNFFGKYVLVVGSYMPIWKDEKKVTFLKSFQKLIQDENLRKKFDNWIILGDMNVLEPNHNPAHPLYEKYEFFYNSFSENGFRDAFRFFYPNNQEYSWFSREKSGYRFDHIFISENFLPLVKNCFYIHETRLEKLSDHSAMCLEISGPTGI